MLDQQIRSILWSWVLIFATIVVAGYAIELKETYYRACEAPPGADADAVYTWLDQDLPVLSCYPPCPRASRSWRTLRASSSVLNGFARYAMPGPKAPRCTRALCP